MSRSKERALLDRISAERMHLPAHVALAVSPAPLTLRFKLRRLGLDLEREEVAALLDLVDQREAQRMLNQQPVSVRYAAVARDIHRRRPWGR